MKPATPNTNSSKTIHLTESPRDAMQGYSHIIPTEHKIKYINSLLQAGFDIIDAGSFVSPKAVPQMADTAQVLEGLDITSTSSEIMVLVVNEKGAGLASSYEKLNIISFPFSVSETFLRLNLKSTLQDSFINSLKINEISKRNNKKFLCYLSMGLGNPYNDQWHPEIVAEWIRNFINEGVELFSIADTTGEANPSGIKKLFTLLLSEFQNINFRLHLHTRKSEAFIKIGAAFEAGITHFESVLEGRGGCPMTGKDLLGNLDTLDLLEYCRKNKIATKVDLNNLQKISEMQFTLFNP